MKKLLFITTFFVLGTVASQECPNLITPLEGATDVPVDTSISWEAVDGVPGYRIRLGTTPGGIELAEATVGTATSYTPAFTLPENTTIYVTIILDYLFLSTVDIVCETKSFTTGDVVDPPQCTQFVSPQDGSVDLSIFTSIFWGYAPTATGYILSIGTSDGGTEILNSLDVGNQLSYIPATEFPENTTLYATVIPYNENGNALGCTSINFSTGELPPLPQCSALTSPQNGSSNVPLDTVLEWNEVAGADGYLITIGSSPNSADIVDAIAIYNTQATVFDFEPNKTYFVTIVPFNDGGNAVGCSEVSFSTSIGCDFFDAQTNENVVLSPSVTFPSTVSLCGEEGSLQLAAPIGADGYRWYKIDASGSETLLSEAPNLSLNEDGEYLLEAYNLVTQFDEVIECADILPFSLVVSETPSIVDFQERSTSFGLEIIVVTATEGNYEFAIDSSDGPYQDSNVFMNMDEEVHTYYVRDKNGCGIDSKQYGPNLILNGFPKFFTPNGDQANDIWQFTLPPESKPVTLTTIRIFDRYGILIKEISEGSKGWDGTLAGRPVPAGGFWFQAIDENNRIYKGHFTLKR